MQTTIELFDAAKAAAGAQTDYQFAKKYGILLATVSTWRTGKSAPSDEHCALFASVLGLDVGYVLACVHAGRAKTDTARSAWAHVAEKLGFSHQGGPVSHNNGTIGIMSNWLHAVSAVFGRVFPLSPLSAC